MKRHVPNRLLWKPSVSRAGEDQATLADALSIYGFFLRWTHQHALAEKEFLEALSIQETIYGPMHPKVATTQIDLASVIEFQGRYESAYDLYLQALETQKQCSGARSVAVGTTLNNIGGLLRKTGRLRESQRALDEAISIYQERLGDAHTWVVVARTNRVVLRVARGDLIEAEREITTLQEISRLHWPDDHRRIAVLSSVRGTVLAGLGRREEAGRSSVRDQAPDRDPRSQRPTHEGRPGPFGCVPARRPASDRLAGQPFSGQDAQPADRCQLSNPPFIRNLQTSSRRSGNTGSHRRKETS
ncbi:MAG: tetratricopeptide repeat protein [Candidatus Eisenbacteria bacterium]